MDVVINLIILLVVISSILKRFSEVSKKGTEVKRPANSNPMLNRPVPTQQEAMPDTVRTSTSPMVPEEQDQPRQTQRRRSIEDLVTELERGYREAFESEASPQPSPVPVVGPEPVYNQTATYSEDSFEETTDGQVDYDSLSVPSTATLKPAVPTAMSPSRPIPAFTSNSLVHAIIMGEILGPPVALRTGMNAHRLI